MIVNEVGVDPEKVVEVALIVDIIGNDSLDQVEVVMALEEEFALDFSDEDVFGWETFGDIIRFLEGAGVPAESDG